MATERTHLLASVSGVHSKAPAMLMFGRTDDGGNACDSDVYHLIHNVYEDICTNIDVPLSPAQLTSPEITFAIVIPLESAYIELEEPSIVFCLLCVRLQFLREATSVLASSRLNQTRADLCEMLATKLLRHQAISSSSSSEGLLRMARALVGGFHPFKGASQQVRERVERKEGHLGKVLLQGKARINALELAILGKARNFIKSQATQRVILAIWEGKITYSSASFLDILPDRWKVQPIRLYNVRDAPILDHYRLRVPKYRALIETASFCVLFVSFMLVILARRQDHEPRHVTRITWLETWFALYVVGYAFDKLASIFEHGWNVFLAGLVNGLDIVCIPIFAVAMGCRVHSVVVGDAGSSDQGYAILSTAACLMFPRLAFVTISNNVLILSLRAMLLKFVVLMAIAVFCFGGFVFALDHLSDGQYSVTRISEYLVFIWFGLDGKGIDNSVEFHPFLGPLLFVSYAALSNTLLVSLLVAILSSTYTAIAADAVGEDMFRQAVMTLEGVKSDSVFDYVPPLNIIAFCIMWPISLCTSPRWFHKINVATTRLFSMPILLAIALYERQSLVDWSGEARQWLSSWVPDDWVSKMGFFEGAHWEVEACFEYPPEESDSDDDSDSDLPSLGGGDDVEEAIEGHGIPSGRYGGTLKGCRASHVLSGADDMRSPSRAGSPRLPAKGSGESEDAGSRSSSLQRPGHARHSSLRHLADMEPPAPPIDEEEPKAPTPKQTRFDQADDDVPGARELHRASTQPAPAHVSVAAPQRPLRNATASYGGRLSTSPERAATMSDFGPLLSSSPGTRLREYTSPLARIYQPATRGVAGGDELDIGRFLATSSTAARVSTSHPGIAGTSAGSAGSAGGGGIGGHLRRRTTVSSPRHLSASSGTGGVLPSDVQALRAQVELKDKIEQLIGMLARLEASPSSPSTTAVPPGLAAGLAAGLTGRTNSEPLPGPASPQQRQRHDEDESAVDESSGGETPTMDL